MAKTSKKKKQKHRPEAEIQQLLSVMASHVNRRTGRPNYSLCAELTKVPRTTLKYYWESREGTKEVEEMKEFWRISFANEAKNQITKALQVTSIKLDRILEREQELDLAINLINKDGEISAADKKSLIAKLKAMKIEDIRSLSTFIGTMFDKHALSIGEATSRQENVNIGENVTTAELEEQARKLLKMDETVGGVH